MDAKPFWASRTLWVNLASLVAAITGIFQVDLGLTPEVQAALVTVAMAVTNMVLRVVTRTPVGVKPATVEKLDV